MAKVKSIYMDRLEAAADRGAADAYYNRLLTLEERNAMTDEEAKAYWEGHDNEQDRKDWG
jgi:hypothetical protein